MFFRFIWGDKPDKIKRIFITQDYKDAGLRMVDLEKYIISLKLSWMNRIVKCEKTDYQRLFEKNITSIHKLLKLGTDWLKHLIQKTRNTFWNEVFMSWIKFSENIDIRNNNDILSSPIWYNPLVSKNILYIPKWFQRGILTIGDIVNEQGHVLDQKEIEKKFNLSQINFLLHRVKICVNIFLGKYRRGDSFNFIPYFLT